MADNQTDSPLLGLPPELRNNIWKMVFEDAVRQVDYDWEPPKPRKKTRGNKWTTKKKKKETSPEPLIENDTGNVALLRVCKQIRHEAIQSFYENTTFSFVQPAPALEWIKKMSTRQPKYLSLISAIRHDAADRYADAAGQPIAPAFTKAKSNFMGFLIGLKKSNIQLEDGVVEGSFYRHDGVKVWSTSPLFSDYYG